MVRSVLFFLFFPVFLNAQGYFQQEVDFLIHAQLDDEKHILRADETIQYKNNSSGSLDVIWFHLWPNGYKNDETEFAKQELNNGSAKFRFSSEEERGYIDSLSFQVDGIPVQLVYDPIHCDIARIILNRPLAPGESIRITTPFQVKIPSSDFSRLGHSGQQYQLCQWFPKPAVFDQKGWHPMPYLNQGEFYSEFGSFEVHISLPSNYVVAASGELQPNPEEEAFITRNIEASEKITTSAKSELIPSSSTFKTVVYKLADVHDFAWFADKNYHIKKSQVQLKRSGRKVDTYIYFGDKDASTWSKALPYMNDALTYYSEWIGDYPYSVCKAVDGALSAGAGMEYPTITIIASPGNAVSLDQVITHEVGHNWFYGILASNERDYPWMDEGTNSYYEGRYMRMKYPEENFFTSSLPDAALRFIHTKDFSSNELLNFPYLFTARKNLDQPLNLPSPDYLKMNYGIDVYMKTANCYNYLAAYLGQELFDKMMQDYYTTWKFRHPQPEDFRKHAELYTDRNLSWFFDDLLASSKRVDYKICGISKKKDPYLIVKNVGQINGPVSISGVKGDSVVTFWSEGFKGSKKIGLPPGEFDYYSVNATGCIPDYNPKNDRFRDKGILRSVGKPAIRFWTGFDNPGLSQLYVFPAIGANSYNGFMAGAGIHNIGLLRKKFEFIAIPLYGFKNKNLAGTAQVDYLVRPVSAFFQTLTFTGSAERFALGIAPNFDRLTGGMTFAFRNRNKNNKIRTELSLKHIYLNYTPYSSDVDTLAQSITRGYNQMQFSFINNRIYNPYGIKLDLQQGKTFAKVSVTADHYFSYNLKNKGLQLRLFAGAFLWKSKDFDNGPNVNFRLSGQTGSQDYLYTDLFFGRNEASGLWSQQMTKTDGGFALYTYFGQSDRYLVSLGLNTTLPGKWNIIHMYSNLAVTSNNVYENNTNKISYIDTQFAAEAGLSLPLVKDVLEIYFPVLYTRNLKDALSFTNQKTYGQQIRFVFNLRPLNPINLVRTLGF